MGTLSSYSYFIALSVYSCHSRGLKISRKRGTRKSQEKKEVRWLPKKYINVAINNTDCLAYCGLYYIVYSFDTGRDT